MDSPYQLRLYWPGRIDTLPALAEKVRALLTELRSVHSRFEQLRPRAPQSSALGPPPRLDDLRPLLCQGAVEWRTGATERVSYRLRFALDSAERPSAEVALTLGVPALAGQPHALLNRMAFDLRGDAGDELVNRRVIEGVLRAGVLAFDPAWGFVGTAGRPRAPMPIGMLSRCEPVVGWMTYLARDRRADQAQQREPATVHAVPGRGHFVVAHPDPFDPACETHVRAVAAVERALREARVLSN